MAEKRAEDSDYEDEDEEEALDDEDISGASPETHPFVLDCQILNLRLSQLINSLLVREVYPVFDNIRNSLCAALDEVDQLKIDTMQKVGIKDDIPIPVVDSAFTTEEGAMFWESVLNPEPSGGGKKGGGKAPKGGISDDQKKQYYRNMYDLMSGVFLDKISDGLCNVDAEMHKNHLLRLRQNSLDDVHLLASTRECDILTENITHVFLKVDGTPFVSEPAPSAFDVGSMARREALLPVIQSALCGAAVVTLVFEDKRNPDEEILFQKSAASMLEILTSEMELLPKNQQKLFTFQTFACKTLAELYHKVSSTPISATGEDGRRVVNVFLLNNLANAEIAPQRKPFLIEDSDDECDSIPIGIDEFKISLLQSWQNKSPDLVSVEVVSDGAHSTVDIVDDAGMALSNLVQSVGGVWIEGNMDGLFPNKSDVLFQLHRKGFTVSNKIREMSLWVHAMSNFQLFSSQHAGSLLIEEVPEENLVPPHIKYIFGNAISKPKFLVTIGGKIRPDKLRVLDYLLDMVWNIYMVSF